MMQNNEKEGRVWCCADMELGSKHTTEEVTERFFKAWKDEVFPMDVVVVCGDVSWTKPAYWMRVINELPGRKILVMGNHDQQNPDWYAKRGFGKVVPFHQFLLFPHEWGNIMFTHVPASPAVTASYDPTRFMDLSEKFSVAFDQRSCILNVHGHTHGRATEAGNTFDVSIAGIGFQPILLTHILERKFKGYAENLEHERNRRRA